MRSRASLVPSSVRKVCQLTGERDRERGTLAFNQTETHFGFFGTDLGSSFEHGGRLWFLFGDTWPGPGPATDSDCVAWTTDANPEPGIHLHFVTGAPNKYKPPVLRDRAGHVLNTGGFEVPIAGISAGGRMYVFYTTDAFEEKGGDGGTRILAGRTVLALAEDDDPTDLVALYDMSRLDQGGKFINVACAVTPNGVDGLSDAGPFLLAWGSGRYRDSDVFLGAVPLNDIRDPATWRFFGGSAGALWVTDQRAAAPLFLHREVGELSVSWVEPLSLWLMLYNAATPRGIVGRVAEHPWGPWSDTFLVFDPGWPGLGYEHFMHVKDGSDGVSDPGREHEWGGEYGPYLIDRYTRAVAPAGKDVRQARIYFVMSTWNPYNTVLMTAAIQREPDG